MRADELAMTLTCAELRALVGEEVRAALANAAARAHGPALLTLEQIAKKMQVSTRTITKWAKEGMPYSRPGAKWGFELEGCRDWARKARRIRK
ncbi:MAG TPA: hypothetical protein VI299_03885 [Polyangiales bacterium]